MEKHFLKSSKNLVIIALATLFLAGCYESGAKNSGNNANKNTNSNPAPQKTSQPPQEKRGSY